MPQDRSIGELFKNSKKKKRTKKDNHLSKLFNFYNNITLLDKFDYKKQKAENLGNKNIKFIPALAEGGIVTEPTEVLAGEEGPEAIIPLDKLEKIVSDMQGESNREPFRQMISDAGGYEPGAKYDYYKSLYEKAAEASAEDKKEIEYQDFMSGRDPVMISPSEAMSRASESKRSAYSVIEHDLEDKEGEFYAPARDYMLNDYQGEQTDFQAPVNEGRAMRPNQGENASGSLMGVGEVKLPERNEGKTNSFGMAVKQAEFKSKMDLAKKLGMDPSKPGGIKLPPGITISHEIIRNEDGSETLKATATIDSKLTDYLKHLSKDSSSMTSTTPEVQASGGSSVPSLNPTTSETSVPEVQASGGGGIDIDDYASPRRSSGSPSLNPTTSETSVPEVQASKTNQERSMDNSSDSTSAPVGVAEIKISKRNANNANMRDMFISKAKFDSKMDLAKKLGMDPSKPGGIELPPGIRTSHQIITNEDGSMIVRAKATIMEVPDYLKHMSTDSSSMPTPTTSESPVSEARASGPNQSRGSGGAPTQSSSPLVTTTEQEISKKKLDHIQKQSPTIRGAHMEMAVANAKQQSRVEHAKKLGLDPTNFDLPPGTSTSHEIINNEDGSMTIKARTTTRNLPDYLKPQTGDSSSGDSMTPAASPDVTSTPSGPSEATALSMPLIAGTLATAASPDVTSTPSGPSEATAPSMSTPAASSDEIYNPDVSGVNGQGLDIDDYVSPRRSSGIAPNPREPLTAPGVNINDYGGGSQAMQTRPPQPLIQPRTPSPTNLAAGNKNERTFMSGGSSTSSTFGLLSIMNQKLPNWRTMMG